MSSQADEPVTARVEALSRIVSRLEVHLPIFARRLDSAEQKIGQLDEYSVEQAQALTELFPHVDRLAEAVEGHGDRLARGPGTDERPQPAVWAVLSPDEAAAAWDELAHWVNTIAIPTLHPTRRQIPPCWPVHSWGRETMSWLHHTHLQAYGPEGSAFQIAEWHTTWVARALAAFAAPNAAPDGYCDDNEHNREQTGRADPLTTDAWAPWLVRARAQDLASLPGTENGAARGEWAV